MCDFKAAIFDMDGTLLDSYEAWEQAFCITLTQCGLHISKEQFIDVYKMTDEQTRRFLMENISNLQLDADLQQVYSLLYDTMTYAYEYTIEPKPGALEFLKELHRKGIPMCVATLSRSDHAEKALERTGMMQYVNFIITGDDVGKSKEFPDIYEEASRRLGCCANETAVFEDSLTAAKTAHEAGFVVYGVFDEHQTYGFEEIMPYTHGAVVRWDSLAADFRDNTPIATRGICRDS